MSYLEVNIRWKIKGKLNSRKSKRITNKVGTNYTLWYSKLKNDFILLLATKIQELYIPKCFVNDMIIEILVAYLTEKCRTIGTEKKIRCVTSLWLVVWNI